MAQMLVIALIVAVVALRLWIAPVPGLMKMGVQRWGMRSTILLCTISLACAGVAIFLSRH